MVIARGWERGKWELLINVYKISVKQRRMSSRDLIHNIVAVDNNTVFVHLKNLLRG